MNATAIIPAAGRGVRFGGSVPKQYVAFAGRPLIEYTLERFERAARVRAVVLAVAPELVDEVAARLRPKFRKLATVVGGGDRRQDSVQRALKAVDAHPDDPVVVHCGARPFIRPALIDRCIEVAAEADGCIVAVPVHDTVKRVAAGEVIAETVDRNTLWLAQTPQAFRYRTLTNALEQAAADGIMGTDEAALVERLGGRVRIVAGDSWNIKITTAEDLAIGEAIVHSGLV